MAATAVKYCTDKSRLLADCHYGVQVWSSTVRSLSDHAGSADFALRMMWWIKREQKRCV
jgi:hypothetical protein